MRLLHFGSSGPLCLQDYRTGPRTACPTCNHTCGKSFARPATVHRGLVTQTIAPRGHRSARLRAAVDYGADLAVSQNSYITLGLAHCFEKDENGKLADRMVVEPLAANSLECMANGAATCFKAVTSMTLQEALQKDKSALPEQFAGATYCSDYEFRCGAAARTWMRPHAQDNLSDIVPLGQVRSNWNYNVERKRVLNFVNVVSDEDNVKQDMSIDVYGRKDKEDEQEAGQAAPKTQEAPAAAEEENDDDLDALLA